MSDIIRLLPDAVANQIAAGEVIQRPASVVKELVENSVDAGATNIQIIIKDAGRTLVQVIDNGCGMSPLDARMAFERHATSKIQAANDLYALHTMGFRGEALASICAVAQVEVRTMPEGESVGTRLVINGSQVESQSPDVCVTGTNIMVRNLFFNIPARRKFLKKDSVEMSNIMHEFERLALVNPGLELTLVHNDITLHQLTRGNLMQRICQLFGRNLEKQLIPIEVATDVVRITGFVCRPENVRRRGALQYLFVNGRNMRHPVYHKAIMRCYEALVAPEMLPNYFVNFEVDPSTIDVNIHPTKNEIKFENEIVIRELLEASVRTALGRFNVMPSIDFEVEDAPEIPVFNPDAGAAHGLDIDTAYNPFAETVEAGDRRGTPSQVFNGGGRQWQQRPAVPDDWEQLYRSFASDTPDAPAPDTAADGPQTRASRLNGAQPAPPSDGTLPGTENIETRVTVMQLKDRYIVSAAKSGLMLIDQHRAHVRILYERFRNAVQRDAHNASQQVMFPEVLRLSPSQNVVLENALPQLERLGYNLGSLGDNAWSVNGVPGAVADLSPLETLLDIIDDIGAERGDAAGDDIVHRVALSMARAAAIRGGQPLAQAEMERLISELFALPVPTYTPDGNTVVKLLTIDDIQKLF